MHRFPLANQQVSQQMPFQGLVSSLVSITFTLNRKKGGYLKALSKSYHPNITPTEDSAPPHMLNTGWSPGVTRACTAISTPIRAASRIQALNSSSLLPILSPFA